MTNYGMLDNKEHGTWQILGLLTNLKQHGK
jgi:hypothetical protein